MIVETTLRLEPVRLTAFDARLAWLGGGKLTRAAANTYLEIGRGIEDATCHLALAGIRATSCGAIPGPNGGLRPAIAFDLEPFGGAPEAIDVVEVRHIPLSQASAALMRRRLPWLRSSRTAREACLRLLREEDVVLGWRRIVWCSIGSMRTLRAHVRLRPVVFDRAALEHHSLRWRYVSDGAIQRWAFA